MPKLISLAYLAVLAVYLSAFTAIAWNRLSRVHDPSCDDPATPYGQIVATTTLLPRHAGANFVTAYSNCAGGYVSNASTFLYNATVGPSSQHAAPQLSPLLTCLLDVYTGMPWQCVEFGRRYLLISYGAVFDGVDGAADIFALPNITVYEKQHPNRTTCDDVTNRTANFTAYDNGRMPFLRAGDVIIYPRQAGEEMPAGHIAAIVDVRTDPTDPATSASVLLSSATTDAAVETLAAQHGQWFALVGEQNWVNAPWKHDGYSRALPLMHLDGRWTIKDTDGYKIDGVKRVQ